MLKWHRMPVFAQLAEKICQYLTSALIVVNSSKVMSQYAPIVERNNLPKKKLKETVPRNGCGLF